MSLIKADVRFVAIFACALAVAALERASHPSEAAARTEAAGRVFDPSRPPSAMREDCRRANLEFFAWRGDGAEGWRYACVNGFISPELLLGL